MFRKEARSKLSVENFSVGSIILGDYAYLVVNTNDNYVCLVNMTTWQNVGIGIQVTDPNWLSIEDVVNLTDTLGLNWTRSDFTFDAEGLKGKYKGHTKG